MYSRSSGSFVDSVIQGLKTDLRTQIFISVGPRTNSLQILGDSDNIHRNPGKHFFIKGITF